MSSSVLEVRQDALSEDTNSEENFVGPDGRPMKVSVSYYGKLPEPLLTEAQQRLDAYRMTASEYRHLHVSNREGIEGPFDTRHIYSLSDLLVELQLRGVSGAIREEIIAVIEEGGFAPKHRRVGNRDFGVSVSFADEDPQHNRDTEEPKENSSPARGW